ncbi:MAG: phosphoribosylamine--glycine ligase [Firmicutes bacterium]|jgi:phosphoribosylamine--glycine ligase|nr:phosphoribosylamine--glycine ligase [Bacillota bacterium]NLZ92532.1 phosphoribosylamine--glycine ligase [Bacillota bacterium]
MRVLVVGSGGREHTLAWKIKQCPQVDKVYCAPGNAGISQVAECVPIAADDITALVDFARKEEIDLTVVGPEAPLTAGIVDAFMAAGLRIFGPQKRAAQLEGSKVFAKELMEKYHIPTAESKSFTDVKEALDYLYSQQAPIVIKADGLAAGKGVVVAATLAEAAAAVKRMLVEAEFGSAGSRIIIEEFLAGEEVTVLAFSDGNTTIPMASSQDHKAAYDHDQGPNTGGMGAYSPAPVLTKELLAQVEREVLQPTITGLRAEGIIFKGVLYAGLMITEKGPKVLEYNVRFGDPECQVILPRLKTDLCSIMLAVINNDLANTTIEWYDNHAACVVMASGGYPLAYEKGKVISGLEEAAKLPDVSVFHAGTAEIDGQIVTAGGRVLGVTAWADELAAALAKAYQAVEAISFAAAHYRHDIGQKAICRKG